MKLNEDWWCAVNWDDFDNEQRKKTVLWLEEHYGKDFMLEVQFGNQFVRPPVRKGKPLSSLKDFSKEKLGYYPNDMLQTMVLILSCWNPAKFFVPYIERVPMREPHYVGISGKIYHTEDEVREADESFRRMFPDLCKLIGEKEFAKVRAKRDDRYEYKVVSRYDAKKENAFYDSIEAALAKARHLTQFFFRLVTGGESIQKYHDFSGFDWMSQLVVEYPKSIHSNKFGCKFEGTSYFEKLCNPNQNDEFLKFVAEL